MTKHVEFLDLMERAEQQRSARRNFIRLCGGAAAMTGGLALLSGCDDDDDDPAPTPSPTPTPVSSAAAQDIAVLSFALQLEYLEANYYAYATTGSGIAASLQTGVGAQGAVIPGTGTGAARAVNFTSSGSVDDRIVGEYAREIAADEIAHVTFLRGALGSAAPAQPLINLSGSATVTANGATVPGAFTAAARAAGVIGATDTFDPYANVENFLIGSYLLTDVGVSAYRGSARLISNKVFLEAAAGILSTEAYHDGVIRSNLWQRGTTVGGNVPTLVNNLNIYQRIQRISDSRDGLDGATDTDQGIGTAAQANLVPTDSAGLVLGRTAPQVLNVVYQNRAAVGSGGFFPAGVNGTITTSGAN